MLYRTQEAQQYHRQVHGTKERRLFYRGEGVVGRAVVNKKSIGVNWELDVWGLLIG